jgi:hypothetical protein
MLPELTDEQVKAFSERAGPDLPSKERAANLRGFAIRTARMMAVHTKKGDEKMLANLARSIEKALRAADYIESLDAVEKQKAPTDPT